MPAMLLLLLLLALSPGLVAQSREAGGEARVGPRAFLPRDREVALARSAAPPSTSDSATIWVFAATGYERAVQGTNGVACHVSRSWPESLEPHCYDPEGAATILPMAMRRVELLHQGVSAEEVDRQIAGGVMDGTFRLPRRPAMSWMMSSAQQLINDAGRPVGNWRPHLMIYFPYLTAADLGLSGNPDLRHAVLVNPGRPDANLMIVVPEFIEP